MLKYHINGIIHSLHFCVQLLSFGIMHMRFIHPITYISCSSPPPSCFLLISIPLCRCITNCVSIPLLKDIWIESRFWWLRIKLIQTFAHRPLCVNRFSFQFHPLWVRLLGHMVNVYLTLKETDKLFFEVAVSFCILKCMRVPVALQPHQDEYY